MSQDDRDAILKRRQRLIASAILSVSIAACDTGEPEPEPCLSIDAVEDTTDADTAPEICLSIDAVDDTGDTSEGDATDGDATDGDAAPEVCLSPPPPDATDDGSDAAG